jgi:quinol monooxygenase YgiN
MKDIYESMRGGVQMLVVVAVLKAKPGKSEDLANAFRVLVPHVHKEPGNIFYTVNCSLDDPLKYLVYEKYDDKQALTVHIASEHFKQFSEAIESVVDGDPDLSLYEEIA